MDFDPSHPLIVGHVAGVFGVKGWLKIRSDTEPLENILSYSPWHLKRGNEWLEYEVAQGKAHGKGLIAQLKGLDDRDLAAELVGCRIAISRSQLPQTAENEYYWSDLIGLQVINQQGQRLGPITSILPTGANDVLVVEQEQQQILIPYVLERYVLEVDLSAHTMLVDWPWLDDKDEQNEG